METEPKLHLPESPAPDGRTAPPTPDELTNGHTDGRTAPPTPDGLTNGHTDGRTAVRREFNRPLAAAALALLTVLALDELVSTVILLFWTPFLSSMLRLTADAFAGGATGEFLETLLLLAGGWGRLCAVLFLLVTAVGSWLTFGGARSAGLALVRVGVVLGGVSSVLYGVDGALCVGTSWLLAGVGVFVWFAATVLLCCLFFRLIGELTRVLRGTAVHAHPSFRLSAAVLLCGGTLSLVLAVLSFFGVVRDASPFVLPFAFGFSSVVLSLLGEGLAGLVLAAELFAFAAFLLRFRKTEKEISCIR